MRGATPSYISRFGRALPGSAPDEASAAAVLERKPAAASRGRGSSSRGPDEAAETRAAIAPQRDRRRFSPGHQPTEAELAAEAMIAQVWRDYRRTGAPALRDRLVIHYMSGHVRRIAMRLKATLPEQVDVEDLVNESYVHLVTLIERFDLERDTRFETFSSSRLLGAMKDYLRQIDPVSRQWRQQSKKIQVQVERFVVRHGRRPDEDELRGQMGRPTREFDRMMRQGAPPLVMSFNVQPARHEGDETDIAGSMEDRRQLAAITDSEREDLRQWIIRSFARRDRLILILYFYEQLNMREIGATLGCSESRVSQRLDSILKCIRSRLKFAEAQREFAGK